MKFKGFVYVTLRSGYSDPEGDTTAEALRGLGYDVSDVRSSKAYRIHIAEILARFIFKEIMA